MCVVIQVSINVVLVIFVNDDGIFNATDTGLSRMVVHHLVLAYLAGTVQMERMTKRTVKISTDFCRLELTKTCKITTKGKT